MKLTDEQREAVLDESSRKIFAGPRRSGKSQVALEAAARAKQPIVAAPKVSMLDDLRARWQDNIGQLDEVTWVPANSSTHVMRYTDTEHPDLVVVDEANMTNQEALFRLERRDVDVLLTATLKSPPSVIDHWYKHSPYWKGF